MSMDQLEAAVNEVSDKDWAWWPFLWLRPEKEQHLSLVRIAVISVLYGLPASVLAELGIKLQYAATVPELIATSLVFPLLFLFFGSVFVAPMWNRRASALRARRAAGFPA
jgi:hypothetical protein